MKIAIDPTASRLITLDDDRIRSFDITGDDPDRIRRYAIRLRPVTRRSPPSSRRAAQPTWTGAVEARRWNGMERRSTVNRRRRLLALIGLTLAATAPVIAPTIAPAVPVRQQALSSGGCAEWACGTNHNQVRL